MSDLQKLVRTWEGSLEDLLTEVIEKRNNEVEKMKWKKIKCDKLSGKTYDKTFY